MSEQYKHPERLAAEEIGAEFTLLPFKVATVEAIIAKHNQPLRAVFPKVVAALSAGGAVSPDCSVGMFEAIPTEVRLVTQNLRARITELEEQLRRASADINAYKEACARHYANLEMERATSANLFKCYDLAADQRDKLSAEARQLIDAKELRKPAVPIRDAAH